MKRIYAFIALLVVFVGCSSPPISEEEVSLMIEEQVEIKLEEMVTETQEAMPTATIFPTPEPPNPNYEAKERTVGSPEENYMIELGYCPISVDISGNPKDISKCVVTSIRTEYIEVGEEKEVRNENIQETPYYLYYQVFCTMYHLDGTYINTNLNNGDGELFCHP